MNRGIHFLFTLTLILISSTDTLLAQNDSTSIEELSIREVEKAMTDENWILIDTRSTDAYNGWKLDGVKRGGHIPGAVDFPANWLDSNHVDKESILVRALQIKGILPDRNIAVYGTVDDECDRVVSYLRDAGYRNLHTFDFGAWVNDETMPLERYENFHLIVPPKVVMRLLNGEVPETFENIKQIKFAEVSWGKEDASYSRGHVPGSFHVNTDDFEPPPEWVLGSPDVLTRFAEQYGFQATDTVILSGEDPTASYRLAIVLRYMGVADVRVLNGGLAAWRSAGYPVETKSTPPPQASAFGANIPGQPELIDDVTRVKAGLRTPHEFTLVDARTWAEFIGETSGYKYHPLKGRIPGSVYGQANFKGENSLSPYRNIDNTMRNADEIKSFWQESNIDTDRHLSFLCGGGWRAAEVLTFAQVMGLKKTSLYSDGWIGWSKDGNNAIESGAPEIDADDRNRSPGDEYNPFDD